MNKDGCSLKNSMVHYVILTCIHHKHAWGMAYNDILNDLIGCLTCIHMKILDISYQGVSWIYTIHYHYIPHLLQQKFSADNVMLPMAITECVLECCGICMHFSQFYHTWCTYDQISMALAFNNNHIIYYQMDMQWSVGLTWTYFTSPDYSVVQCWVHSMFFSPIPLTKQNPMHIIIFSFEDVVDYMPLGFPCIQPMDVIDFSNDPLPFVITAYPALSIIVI